MLLLRLLLVWIGGGVGDGEVVLSSLSMQCCSSGGGGGRRRSSRFKGSRQASQGLRSTDGGWRVVGGGLWESGSAVVLVLGGAWC